MSVKMSVWFACANTPKKEITTRVTDALAMFRMQEYTTAKPTKLSGGQQQRAHSPRPCQPPQLLLLDEPLSALAANLRKECSPS